MQVSVRAAVQVLKVVVQLHLLHPAASHIGQFIPVCDRLLVGLGSQIISDGKQKNIGHESHSSLNVLLL